MTADQCVEFLKALRAKNIYVKDNGWVSASCVLARWTHKSHVDHSPSFALSVTPGGRSYFLCFACRQGSAEELVAVLEMYTHHQGDYDFARCHQILNDEEHVVPLPEYGEFQQPTHVFTEWPQYWLDSFQKVGWNQAAMHYLAFRDVSMTMADQFNLRYDPKRSMIIAPYWDVFKRLAGARGRSIVDMVPHKHHDYTFQNVNNAKLVWFNEQVLNLPGPVVVVEGQFDAMRTVQAFPKTVANLTAKPTIEKMKKLGDCGTVIQIPDRDEAGQESVYRYAKYCAQFGLTHKVVWLDEGCKDPAECSPEYSERQNLRAAIGAIMSPVPMNQHDPEKQTHPMGDPPPESTTPAGDEEDEFDEDEDEDDDEDEEVADEDSDDPDEDDEDEDDEDEDTKEVD